MTTREEMALAFAVAEYQEHHAARTPMIRSDNIVKNAVKLADALIEELRKEKSPP